MEQIIQELQVHNFSKIPNDLLENMDKVGIDSQDFNLVEKKVGFSRSKIDYFNWTRTNSTTIGGSGLYIFNATQKEESVDYDAVIVYWSKFLFSVEQVINQSL